MPEKGLKYKSPGDLRSGLHLFVLATGKAIDLIQRDNNGPCLCYSLKCAVRTQDTTVSQALEQRSRSTKARAGDGDGPAYDQTTEGLSIWGLLEIRLHAECQYQGCDQRSVSTRAVTAECQYQGCDQQSVSTRAVTSGVSVPGL
ncbi:unnamed protein product [Boreogadus saida]